MSQFAPGQRWISNTESNLGLGIVVDVANRRVTLSFPAAGEERTYAVDNAPVSRVTYHAGETILNNDEEELLVEAVEEHNGCKIYLARNRQDQQLPIHEIELSCFVQFNSPLERLFAGQVNKPATFQLRADTLDHYKRLQRSPISGLMGPRVQRLPHQLYIAQEVASRHAPRVLLADEVGLGKTIEAGLIVHQQLYSGRAERVLICVPDSLVHQWLVEMLRRFNLSFTLLDEQRCQDLEHSGHGNPFESAQLVLCTLSFLTGSVTRHQQAVEASWDLMVVDEAHHLQWREEQPSEAYLAIEALAQQARGLLLLTATPEQLGVASHFARLRLLDPHRYHDLTAFIEEEQQYQPVNTLVQHLLAEDAAQQLLNNPQRQEELAGYVGQERLTEILATLREGANNTTAVIGQIIKDLLDHHGTGRVLFRNTRATVEGFPPRVLNRYPLEGSDDYYLATSAASLEDQLRPENILGENWLEQDPRVEWLVTLLRDLRPEKVLVICAQAQTALELEAHLRFKVGLRSSVFHEGLSLVNRDRAAAYFAEPEDGAQVLICSEIGSEGRNFQFSHNLVLFDLPTNPDLLEQRIGRLDRIGQRHDVQIHVPYYQDSSAEALLRWYHEGINALETPCPAAQALYQQFAAQLQAVLQGDSELEPLLIESHSAYEQALAVLQQGRDQLLELNSCNREQADAIVDELIAWENSQELSRFMERVFDDYGVEQEHHSEQCVILRPGDHMRVPHFPGIPEDGLTATYRRETALSREDMHFLTWEHPIVTGAMDMILNSERGTTSFCTLKLPPLKAGTLLLEAVYEFHCPAPKALQVQRYLPADTLRVVLDAKGNNLSQVLTAEVLDRLSQRVPKSQAAELIKHVKSDIATLVAKAEQQVAPQQGSLLAAAQHEVSLAFDGEINRLHSLAAINPNIRQDEIEALASHKAQLLAALEEGQLKLSALRVAVAT